MMGASGANRGSVMYGYRSANASLKASVKHVQVSGRIMAELLQVETFQNIQRHQHHDPARIRRRLIDFITAIVDANRRRFFRLELCQVVVAKKPPFARGNALSSWRCRRDRIRSAPRAAIDRNRSSQIGLNQPGARYPAACHRAEKLSRNSASEPACRAIAESCRRPRRLPHILSMPFRWHLPAARG